MPIDLEAMQTGRWTPADVWATIAELRAARARVAELEEALGRLRVAAGAYVAALTAVEDGPEGTSDDEFRQQAARVEAGWKVLRAALEESQAALEAERSIIVPRLPTARRGTAPVRGVVRPGQGLAQEVGRP